MTKAELQAHITNLLYERPEIFADLEYMEMVVCYPYTLGFFGRASLGNSLWEYIHTEGSTHFHLEGTAPQALCRELASEVPLPFRLGPDEDRLWSFLVPAPTFHEIANWMAHDEDPAP